MPFKKGEILFIVNKDEEQWWTARNLLGQTGQIPVPYVEMLDENSRQVGAPVNPTRSPADGTFKKTNLNVSIFLILVLFNYDVFIFLFQRKLPAYARVKQARVPNAYDKTALKLEVGDVIKVTKMNINGQWEGELRGKVGFFPFTHIEFLSNDDDENFNGNLIGNDDERWGD